MHTTDDNETDTDIGSASTMDNCNVLGSKLTERKDISGSQT